MPKCPIAGDATAPGLQMVLQVVQLATVNLLQPSVLEHVSQHWVVLSHDLDLLTLT